MNKECLMKAKSTQAKKMAKEKMNKRGNKYTSELKGK